MSNFVGYPESTRRFYAELIYASLLNIAAVRQGLFDEYFSADLTGDTWFRFVEAQPEIHHHMVVGSV
jgi:hypothetical protein